jgi:uncharacterized Zn finger protein (UPF0148 family)
MPTEKERPMTENKHTCQARFYSQWSSTPSTCNKTAKMEHEGKHYCGIHDPVKKQAKRDEKHKEWNDRYEASKKAREEAEARKKLGEESIAKVEVLQSAVRELVWFLDEMITQQTLDKGTGADFGDDFMQKLKALRAKHGKE